MADGVEQPGAVIDKYKLVQQIGEGGFGVVYLAEQEQPVRRQVALKVVKLGMDTKEVIARFDAERQALAMMEHPNIARGLPRSRTPMARSGGVECVRLPPQSPNMNAFAERFVLSIKSECLDRVIPIGERHLRRCITEYVEHYHIERPHQGLGNEPIEGVPKPVAGRVARSDRLGGMLRSYHREAA